MKNWLCYLKILLRSVDTKQVNFKKYLKDWIEKIGKLNFPIFLCCITCNKCIIDINEKYIGGDLCE